MATASLKTIAEASDLKGKKVLLRLDLNMEVKDGRVVDAYRLERSARTLQFLKDAGAKTIIIAHLDEKEGGTLLPAFEKLKEIVSVRFSSFEKAKEDSKDFPEGSFLLLENIRHNAGEKRNDPAFAEALASLADVYVNEAFSVSHREHASIVGVPKFLPHYAGFLLKEEVEHLSEMFFPSHPFLFILGGAKPETKMALIEKFLSIAEQSFIGGAVANDFLKAKGFPVGASLVSDTPVDLSSILSSPTLFLPTDVVVEKNGIRKNKAIESVESGEAILDLGKESIRSLKEKISKVKCVLWNGTLGLCERGFEEGTNATASAIVEAKIHSVVGGGDTLTALSKIGLRSKFSFVSTGGGAMLQFLAEGTLPGIKALIGE